MSGVDIWEILYIYMSITVKTLGWKGNGSLGNGRRILVSGSLR